MLSCPILCVVLIFRAHCNFVESLTNLLGLEVNQVEKYMALRAAKKPKLTLKANSDVEEAPIFDPNEAAHRLCLHWSGIFEARNTNIPNDQVPR